MRRFGTTWRRVVGIVWVFAALSLIGSGVGLSVGRAATRVGWTGTIAAQSITTTTGTTTTATTTTATSTVPSTTATTTTRSTTSPTPGPLVCKGCTPVLDLGAVTRPLLGFGYGGRRLRAGGIALVAVIIDGDDDPLISRLVIRLPGPLSRDLPVAERHLIRTQGGRITYSGRSLTVRFPKQRTDETVTIPAAALASSVAAKPRLDIGLMFQVRQGRASRRLGSDVQIG